MENFINHAFLVSIKSGGSMVDEYELIPEKEILELKKEINELKSHLGLKKQEDVVNDKKDVEEGQLIFAIKELTEVFKKAVDELKKQDAEPKKDSKSSGKLSEDKDKIDILIEQNNKIAKGIVALADLLENNLQKLTEGLLQQPKIKYIRIPIPPQENTQNPSYSPQYNQQYTQPGAVQGAYAQQPSLNPKQLPPQPPLNPSQLKGQVIPKAPSPTLSQRGTQNQNQRIPNLNPQRTSLQKGLLRKQSKRQIRF